MRSVIGGLMALAVMTGGAAAQEAMEIERLSGPIVFDGRVDEAAWEAVEPLPLTMYYPTFRGSPAEQTEIRVAYDDAYFYASGRFFDSRAAEEGVRINSLYRDRWNGDDAFAIYIDAFNDNQNAKWFGTTPSGMRFDLLVSDDGATLNGSWDTFWDVRTTVTDEGWFAEVRIPFSSIGFQAADGVAQMGLTVTRLVSRTSERVTFPAIDPQFPFRQPSVAQDIVLRDVQSSKPVYVTPYLLGGVERTPALGDDGSAFEADSETLREVGLDLRYNLSSNLQLDLTANMDFAQVEADDQRVNLDRFSLFFPEKRRFFQERSGIFEFTGANNTRLFHSRAIGLSGGEPVPVLAGARLVGRMGEWDVGVFNMQTDDHLGTAGENFGVARLRRRVINPYSFVGAMATTRVSEGQHNIALGTDGIFRIFGDTYLTTRASSSFDDSDTDALSLWDRSMLHGQLQRRANRGLAYTATFTRVNGDYRPEMGFLARRDFTQLNWLASWYFFTDDHPWLRRIWPGMLAFSTFRNGDGSLESGQYALWVQWETKGGFGGWLEPKLFVEDVLDPFSIGGEVEIPAGRHEFADFQVALQMPAGRRLRTNLDARAGTFFDGTRAQIILGPTWNVSPNLELGADYQFTRLDFGDRDQRANIHLTRLRIRTAVDSRLSGNAFVQYSTTSDQVDLNVRVRYNFAEGTDLWLVYNEGLRTERDLLLDGPRLPLSQSRTLMLKYSYTFSL